jgi:hypothetical protein
MIDKTDKIIERIKKQETEEEIKTKIVVAGNLLEFYEFEQPIKKSPHKLHTPARKDLTDDEKMENRRRSLMRIKTNIKRYFHCNDDLNRFVTLTFKKNITDLSVANACFKRFIQRLRFNYPDIKYLAVVEFQERGAIHYHLVINRYIKNQKLREIWRNGFVRINHINDRHHLICYVSKYFTKNKASDRRLWGQKAFFRSKNLQVWVTMNNITYEDFDNIVTSKANARVAFGISREKFIIKEGSYTSDYIGKVNVWSYDLSGD